MPFLTMDEFNNTKVYALENSIYKRIERAFIDAFGDKVAAKILGKFQDRTVRELSTNSYVDIMSSIMVL